ncbi:MAG: hypothetical protein K6G87_04225 [Butyrivibrio sp.]|uniref:DUF5722 domain-containing protein n=1 Tax=Butyrivibrio sp. TaxID=28121 RepID=UPI0025E82BB3|nr:DUF5722 domain-containing protein [Butyrivibrio sp.]MCR5770426.1 hypothetical protein [Butyrivibrio sp.]
MRGNNSFVAGVRRGICTILCAVLVVMSMMYSDRGTITAQADGYVSLSASISGSNVVIKATTSSVPSSADGLYHLYAQNVYDTGVTGTEVATAAAGKTATFTVALNNNSASSMLYKKFVIATSQGGVMTQVSNAAYITNPEVLATHTVARVQAGKKGIIPESTMIHSGDIVTLGIDQCSYNLLMSQLLNKSGAQIAYNYNGKTYNFNAGTVQAYDWLISMFKQNNISCTMVLLNDWHSDTTSINPLSRSAGHSYYAYNAADQSGVELLAAIGSFLASRYSNQGLGQIDNFVIGNEINARYLWNYMSNVDVTTYTVENANAFRVFYNAIKSQNANANVYTCIDQMWASTNEPNRYYAGKDYIDIFNSYISSEGNIDWSLAVHPYDVPLTNSYAWNNSTKYVTHDISSPYVAMQNIEVVTDYMCTSTFKAPDGDVRSIICSEVGYSSTAGEAIQAAAITYAYEVAMHNQYIDAFIYNKEMDAAVEMAQGLSLGLVTSGGAHKQAYTYYQNLDGANAQQYINAAAATIGVTDLNSILVTR